jgi:ADP-dependent NAD(P)H-hydrate dehydratase / NAD(P)H-hydrate epimerase
LCNIVSLKSLLLTLQSLKFMKLFTTKQIADIDRYTIGHEPISEIDLMERAASQIYQKLAGRVCSGGKLVFFAGPGNNGGDALALARMFAGNGFNCTVYLLDTGKPLRGSPAINWQRLVDQDKANLLTITSELQFPSLDRNVPIIEGLFGSGLQRPLSGLAAGLVRHINVSGCRVWSIDIPAGLMGENNEGNDSRNIIRADVTYTLQFPKLSLLFSENEIYSGSVKTVDIGLHPVAIAETNSPYTVISALQVSKILPPRRRFSHKGTFGHALFIGGSYGKMGAAVLSAKACIRSGTGLVTAHVPEAGYQIMQTAVPEVMCSIDPCMKQISTVPDLSGFSAVGIGPGLGTGEQPHRALEELLQKTEVPLIADADALNILAEDKKLLSMLPQGTVITPHPGEFRRLFGATDNSWTRLQLQSEMAIKYRIIILLKGAWSAIAFPTGEIFFNPTGNPGMATGGSGDALTGIILGLMAQGVPSGEAAIAGTYLHGLAGDLAARKISQPSLIASDIIKFTGKAFRNIYNA